MNTDYILQLILERKNGALYDDMDFYMDVYATEEAANRGFNISGAMEISEEATKAALCDYVFKNGLDNALCDYISSVTWVNR